MSRTKLTEPVTNSTPEAPMAPRTAFASSRLRLGSTRKSVAQRAVALLLAALLCTGCFGMAGCTPLSTITTAARISGLIGSGPSSYSSTFVAAEKGPRPSVTPESRDRYVNTSTATSATILVYMVGSDLESEYGNATADLQEMCEATYGTNVRILIQAGGCSDWQNNVMVSGTGRYEIADGTITTISDLGKFDTLTTDALANFVSWGASYAPADRTELILWDHGGGTFDGFGYDEYYEESVLTLGEIDAALDKAKVKLDFLGFDACLMGTMETAYAVRDWADYLIASEESEPETGWYYTNWITSLAATPSIETSELGRGIVDDYVAASDSNGASDNEATLSVVDLTKIDWLYGVLGDYLGAQKDSLSDNYTTIAAARANAKDFGEGEYDQIDMVDYLDRFATDDSGRVAAAVESTVTYTASSRGFLGANGLAMYYPYDYVAYYSEVYDDLTAFGFDGKAKEYFDSFVELRSQGSSLLSSDGVLGGLYSMIFGSSSTGTLADSADRDGTLTLKDKGSYYALQLSDEQWETVVYAELWVFLDDGEGYIDLGADDTYEFDDDGDLKVDFDKKWLALDGQVVPFYAEGKSGEGSDWYEYGYVPAELNESTDIDIMIYFDAENPNGKVVGYRQSNEGKPQVQAKGYKQFKAGDKIDFICDFYDYSGNYDGEYYYGDQITYNGQLDVSWDSLRGETVEICYMLQDVYGNEYYTEYVDL